MKYNVLRLYISAFHPKANVVYDLAGLLAKYTVQSPSHFLKSGIEV